MLALYVLLLSFPTRPARRRGEDGQTAAEYALVLLGAATVALAFTAWATHTHTIGHLYDAVMGRILARVR
ncbi:MAG TPA: hypothetical protein VFJ85_10275 [Acidimicrobiales bacterium]|nr:hypothetical protein [Acidimicrobiales bacterium]